MAKRDIVVIGTSAGGVDALQQVVKQLPADFPAAILVVLHTSSHTRSYLPQILQRSSALTAIHPEDGTPIERGRIYVARPDFHLMVEPGRLRVVRGPRENLHRPAVDPLFRSAAAVYGRRVIGVILTGLLDDGTSGLMTVHKRGGAAVVQDPETALFPAMPRNAQEFVPDARVVPLQEIPKLLVELTQEEIPEPEIVVSSPDNDVEKENRIAEFQMREIEEDSRVGKPSVFGCPDCGGVLWEINQDGLVRYRCRVGHAYTTKHLAAQQRHKVEDALWAGLRALEESASLSLRMASRAGDLEDRAAANTLLGVAKKKEDQARTLREMLLQSGAAADIDDTTGNSA